MKTLSVTESGKPITGESDSQERFEHQFIARGVGVAHHQRVIDAYSAALERIDDVRGLIWSRHFRDRVDTISKYGEAIVTNCRQTDPLDIYEDRSLEVKLERVAQMIEEWAKFENGLLTLTPRTQALFHETIDEVVGGLARIYDRMRRNDEIATIARVTTTRAVLGGILGFEAQHGKGREIKGES